MGKINIVAKMYKVQNGIKSALFSNKPMHLQLHVR